jgi:hypothetical protein
VRVSARFITVKAAVTTIFHPLGTWANGGKPLHVLSLKKKSKIILHSVRFFFNSFSKYKITEVFMNCSLFSGFSLNCYHVAPTFSHYLLRLSCKNQGPYKQVQTTTHSVNINILCCQLTSIILLRNCQCVGAESHLPLEPPLLKLSGARFGLTPSLFTFRN